MHFLFVSGISSSARRQLLFGESEPNLFKVPLSKKLVELVSDQKEARSKKLESGLHFQSRFPSK